MDKKKQFEDKLDNHLHKLAKNIVFNRNPLSIEFHKADFSASVMRDFEEIFGNSPENIEMPEPNIEQTKEVLLKVAKEIRRMNRLRTPKKPAEPKLKIL